MKGVPEALRNLRGETAYIDDLPEPRDLLHAAVQLSEGARGKILSIDPSRALALDPAVRVVTAHDVPGENQIGSAVPDEPLLPEGEWEYWGQPLVLCLAPTRQLAREAARLVTIVSETLRPVLDPREAAGQDAFVMPSRTQSMGNPGAAFAAAAFTAEGRVESGGQEHLYLETQGAYAERRDGDRVFVISSTQGTTIVQRAIARVLGLPQSGVEVEARRLGGGFGGKEDQATPWACLAALGAWVSGKPVKLYLDRATDMRATGKRHPYSTDFRIAADKDGRITAFEADYYQNSGSSCDLSPAIMSRTLFHAAGAYRIPNLRVTGRMCRTNLPSFTAFRGFGAPQGYFVIEAALDAISNRMGFDPVELRRRNLLSEGDVTHYGMPLKEVRAIEAFDRVLEKTGWKALRADIEAFNASHPLEKRGAAIIPNCFGVSFTKLPMNRGGALVHVHADGSVLVSTGAVEMGQQVSRKIARIAAKSLGVPLELIRVERTSSPTVANTVPTAASTGCDINGAAARVACLEIRDRLLAHAATLRASGPGLLSLEEGRLLEGSADTSMTWKQLVTSADESRVDLSAHGYWSTPGLFYDMKTERGSPFAYHVYGAALVEVRLDCLCGRVKVERATIVHDAGTSIDPVVDLCQVEGAFAQGLGWALLEELRFGADGRPMSDNLSTYKVPDVHFLPARLDIEFLSETGSPASVLNSKAIGEPPLIYGIAGYFALLEAIRAARGDRIESWDLPLVPEKVLGLLAGTGRVLGQKDLQ